MKANRVTNMMAYVWMDCDNKYFITIESSLSEGNSYSKIRWKQPDFPEADFGEDKDEEEVL